MEHGEGRSQCRQEVNVSCSIFQFPISHCLGLFPPTTMPRMASLGDSGGRRARRPWCWHEPLSQALRVVLGVVIGK